MFKKVITSIGAFFISHIAISQSLGITAGLNWSRIHSTYEMFEKKSDPKAGFRLGIEYQVKLDSNLSILPSLNYTNVGTTLNNNLATLSNAKWNLDYSMLEVLFGFRAVKNIYIVIGPQLSCLMIAKENSDDLDGKMTSAFKVLDVAAAGGIRYNINRSIHVSAQYNFGLKDINEKILYLFNEGRLYNRSASVILGYYIK